MSKAPEWIYLDGDVEAGDGMFPRCFENPKYASELQVEYVRVDLAEAAEQQGYASAIEDARKLHEARIEELEAKLTTCEKYRDAYAECDRIGTQAVRDLEAKLAKAMRHVAEYSNDPHLVRWARRNLAELTGGEECGNKRKEQ